MSSISISKEKQDRIELIQIEKTSSYLTCPKLLIQGARKGTVCGKSIRLGKTFCYEHARLISKQAERIRQQGENKKENEKEMECKQNVPEKLPKNMEGEGISNSYCKVLITKGVRKHNECGSPINQPETMCKKHATEYQVRPALFYHADETDVDIDDPICGLFYETHSKVFSLLCKNDKQPV